MINIVDISRLKSKNKPLTQKGFVIIYFVLIVSLFERNSQRRCGIF
jgi:hypothetical protein